MRYVKLFEDFVFGTTMPNIAVYYDYGVRQDTFTLWSNFFRKYYEIEPHMFSSEEFSDKDFSEFDMVVIPGGDSYKENLSLQEKGKDKLRKYVDEGGKILGICAGAFLITECYDWSMGLIPLKHNDDDNDHLLDKTVYLDFLTTEKGKEVFNTTRNLVNSYFHLGPVMYESGNCEVLLKFAQEIPRDDQVKNFGIDKVAAGYSQYGKGHALAISPHFEKTEDAQYLLHNAINYLLKSNA